MNGLRLFRSTIIALTIGMAASFNTIGNAVQAGNVNGHWTTRSPYPTAITNNAVASVCDGAGCTIYSFMGMTLPTSSSSVTAASYKLESPGDGPWIQIADAPLLNGKAKIGASAISCGGNVYLIGGYTIGGAEVTEPRLFRYDDGADTYVQLADVPTEVDDTVVGTYEDRYIYLVSGWHGPINANVTNVQLYDTQTNTWQQATPIPTLGRFGHAGGAVFDRLVFIDGSQSTAGFPIQHTTHVGVIDPGNPTLITWTSTGPNPLSPTYRAANSQGFPPCNYILFSGGTDNPYNFNGNGYNGQPSNPLDQTLAYDPATNEWITINTSGGADHSPTMDHRGFVWFDGAWVTVGGMRGPGVATNTVNALVVPGLCSADAIPTVSEWGVVVMMVMLVVVGTFVLRHERRTNSIHRSDSRC